MRGRTIREQLQTLRIDRRDEAAPRRRWPWALAALLLVAVAVAAALPLLRSRAPEVEVLTVREETGGGPTTVLNASGYVTARRRATVASKVTGRIVELAIEEGMPVRRGQVLARLDASMQQAQLAWSEANLAAARGAAEETHTRLAQARLDLGRAERLLAEAIVGQAEYDRAKTEVAALTARAALEQQQVDVAQSEVALRRVDVEDTIVRAPFDGVIVSKDAQEGEIVSPVSAGGGFTRTGIGTVVDMDSLEIEVDVNEAFISRVQAGQPVEAVIDAYPDWRIPARVITTIPTADRQKATVQVRIAFEEIDARVLPDMGVKVSFQEPAPSAATQVEGRPRIVVPRTAVRRDGGRDVVFVLQQDRVERRAVTLGGGSGDAVEIVAGLRGGERVVAGGPEGLTDGDRVRVKEPEGAER